MAGAVSTGPVGCAGRCQHASGSSRAPCRPRRQRRCLVVRANLLDLLRGGSGGSGGSSLEPDVQGEALKQWMMERGLSPQKVRRQWSGAKAIFF